MYCTCYARIIPVPVGAGVAAFFGIKPQLLQPNTTKERNLPMMDKSLKRLFAALLSLLFIKVLVAVHAAPSAAEVDTPSLYPSPLTDQIINRQRRLLFVLFLCVCTIIIYVCPSYSLQ